MKRLGDREIGRRAALLIGVIARKNKRSIKAEMKRLGLSKNTHWEWSTGQAIPSAFALQRMLFAGYDVIYILKGGDFHNDKETINQTADGLGVKPQ